MVANHNIDEEHGRNPKTLGDWVKNVRLKKIEMRRKLRSGGNLRVCAILSTALMTAELELRRKQQERFQKWLEFQTKISRNCELQPRSELRQHQPLQRHQQIKEEILLPNHQSDEKNCRQSEEITNLWKCELSELDNFMRSISSSGSKSFDHSIGKTHNVTKERDNLQTLPIRVSS